MYDILNKINGPEDVKKLNNEELEILAEDIREGLFNRLTKHGGHFGPNFGMVETEIAMHYVFSSPVDKFVFDVSHQSYPHKMMTGRKLGYIDENHFHEDSGYTNPEESEHDFFNVGHTSTSISLATGLAKGRDIKGGKENIIAVIGDGSLSGGEALEGLNVAGSELDSNLIIIVNDNQQSISETHGGLYKSLEDLRNTNGESSNNIFKAFGLDYIYEPNGNDIQAMIKVLSEVKDSTHPVVVHINTQKGKGYKLAEENRENWHWTMPFDRKTGKPTVSFGGESYTGIAHDYIMGKAKRDSDVVVITPNMPGSFGLSEDDRNTLGKQFVDVGIAEEQAVAMASGVATNGAKPLVVTNATFMQRTYDQISHDVCIDSKPVTFLLNFANFDGLTDVTHLGIFAISMFSNIPNLVMLSPSSKEELVNMLEWSLDQDKHPVMILMPGDDVESRNAEDKDFSSLDTYKVEEKGENVAIVALGDFFKRGKAVAEEVKAKLGYTPTLINPRFASGLDTALLEELKKDHSLVITLEDGIVEGGFGAKIASYYGADEMLVKNYGLQKLFYDRYDPEELLKEEGADTASILKDIEALVK